MGYIKCIVRSAVVHCINGRQVNAFTRNNLEDTVNKCQIHLEICQLLKIHRYSIVLQLLLLLSLLMIPF